MTDIDQPSLSSENEISKTGKLLAGILLVLVTAAAITGIVALWPDKMPAPALGDDAAWYHFKLFNVTLLENESTKKTGDTARLKIELLTKKLKEQTKSADTTSTTVAQKKRDSAIASLADSINASLSKPVITPGKVDNKQPEQSIHLNTIILLLVAFAGLLGNMLHIATSFTTYIGNNTFRRSWILWYFVKPFTAAGLAIVIYFIIRAGFFSYGAGAAGISLYGVLSLAALAGLFTDSATLKLKEIFDVIFKPKDERKDKLLGDDFTVTDIVPGTLHGGKETKLLIKGSNLTKVPVKILMDDKPVVATTKNPDAIEIVYTPSQDAINATKSVLTIVDTAGKQLFKKEIPVQ